jgi:hypothetical protein
MCKYIYNCCSNCNLATPVEESKEKQQTLAEAQQKLGIKRRNSKFDL